MSAFVTLLPKYAHRRAEVESDAGTLCIRVDDDLVSWTPHTRALIDQARRALDAIESHLMIREAQGAA